MREGAITAALGIDPEVVRLACISADPASRVRAAVVAATRGACRRHFGTSMRALILTGSLSRDEATIVAGPQELRVLGDAEFMLVLAGESDTPHLPAAAADEIQAVLRAQGIACPVSVALVGANYLRGLTPHIFGVELRQTGKVVDGEADILSLIPPLSAAAIPLHDAWNLVSNRIVEMLETSSRTPSLPQPGDPAQQKLGYAALKLQLDLATAYLVARGCFVPGYRARQRALAELVRTDPPGDAKGPFAADFAARVARCTDWKLAAPGQRGELPADLVEAAVDDGLRLWNWLLARMGDAPATTDDGWRCMARRQSARSRLRGWLYLLRRQGWRGSPVQLRQWCRQAVSATPRLWIYRAAAGAFSQLPALLRGGELEPARLRHLNAMLPVPSRSACGWRELATAVAWNYHAFAENTRS